MKYKLSLITLAMFLSATSIPAAQYAPLLDGHKELGYVEYIPDPVSNPDTFVNYYRITCSNSCEFVGGIAYKEVWQYSTFAPIYVHRIAYMREENGKVYIRYTEDCETDPFGYFTPGKEYLAYDFSMNEGDNLTLEPNTSGEEPIVLKCIETGNIETEEGARKYLRFDRNVNETTRRWMAFEYIIEGIGPIGNCNIAFPYRYNDKSTDNSHFEQIDFLYTRELLKPDDEDIRPQGDMFYRSPLFEVKGVYDPTVWFWRTKSQAGYNSSVKDIEQDATPFNGINMLCRDGVNYIVSNDADLTEVVVFDLVGRTLAVYTPDSREFRLNPGSFDTKIVIVRATTANGSRSFKLN